MAVHKAASALLILVAAMGFAGCGGGGGGGGNSASLGVTIANLVDKGKVETGFVVGKATGSVATVEVSLDGGAYAAATGTTAWSYKLPTGATTWKDSSKHTIAARAVQRQLRLACRYADGAQRHQRRRLRGPRRTRVRLQ